ncbi:MAG: hypothetical protein LBL50_02470 [Candidatus Margulisbacteria bacterium]|jgi:hypothetical protein|nr:hypothetical protein [Candidatus Margulisiibacteriota bacterium]
MNINEVNMMVLSNYGEVILQDKQVDEAETNNLISLLGEDKKLSAEEYGFLIEFFSKVNELSAAYGIDVMSEALKTKLAEYADENFVMYYDSVTDKYPVLIDLRNSLPEGVQGIIDEAVINNLASENLLNKPNWRNYTDVIAVQNDVVAGYLKELRTVMLNSPYKAELEKIYNAETALLQNNQRKVQ